MSAEEPIYLLDVTSGKIGKLINHFERLRNLYKRPPEGSAVFPPDNLRELPQIRVSVQVSEERLRTEQARQREMERASGFLTPELEAKLYAYRTAQDYEEQAKRNGREAKQKVVHQWDTLRGNIHNPKIKRAVILGDPGFGKTWLLYHEAWQLAEAEIERLKTSQVGTRGVIVPVFAKLANLAEKKGSLIQRLEAVLKQDAELRGWEDFAGLWPVIKDKAESGQALVLLDGFDEVPPSERKNLKEAIEAYAEGGLNRRIYLTSRIAGYQDITLEPRPKVWELVAFNNDQVKSFVRGYFRADDDAERNRKAHALLEHWRRTPPLQGLGRIPLMLALLCRLAWDKKPSDSFPTRRVDIYDKCLWGLVYEWKYQRTAPREPEEVRAGRAETTIRWLADVCLRLFLDGARVDAWSRDELRRAIRTVQDGPQTEKEILEWLAELVADGVLVRDGGGVKSPLRFIHRTFHEYLVASALAERTNNKGWSTAEVEAEKTTVTIERLIEAKSWSGEWQEVIALLAGKLVDPSQLLTLLSNKGTDDLLRHRICVAALCLDEVKANSDRTLVDRIAQDISRAHQSGETLRNVDRYLAAAARASKIVIDQMLVEIRMGRASIQYAALALGDLGQVAAVRADVIDALLALLRDPDAYDFARAMAAEALGDLGHAAAELPDVIDTLLDLVRDSETNYRTRASAVDALGKMGQVVADRSDILDTFFGMLRVSEKDHHMYVDGVAHALGKLGQAAADPSYVIDGLLSIVRDFQESIWPWAVEILGNLGQVVANRSDVIDALLARLRTSANTYAGFRVTDALGKMGSAAADPFNLVEATLGLLRDKQLDIHARAWAADALGTMSQASADPSKLTDAILDLLHDEEPNGYAHGWVAEALGKMGQVAAARSDVSTTLLGMLRNSQNGYLSYRAAVALVELGQAAVDRSNVIDGLLELAPHSKEHGHEYGRAIEALKKLCQSDVDCSDVIDALFECYRDKELHVDAQSWAAHALGSLGEAAADRSEVINAFLGVMRDPRADTRVRSETVAALGNLGQVVAKHSDVMDVLIEMLSDCKTDHADRSALDSLREMLFSPKPDYSMQFSAASALERFNVRVFRDGSRKLCWKRVAELSALKAGEK